LESFVTKESDTPFYISPRIISDDPSIMAFSDSSSFFFLPNIFVFLEVTFSAIVSVRRLHFYFVPVIVHWGPLIQLIGVVKSAAKEKCSRFSPFLMKGIT